MMSSKLPLILEKQVDALARSLTVSKIDLYLAAKLLWKLSANSSNEALIMSALLLERAAKTANETGVSTHGIVENLKTMHEYFVVTKQINVEKRACREYLSHLIKKMKTLFGLMTWVDEKTKKWFID